MALVPMRIKVALFGSIDGSVALREQDDLFLFCPERRLNR